ncbi:MAG TPA: efflux RND transporter periplasmic adaptor subunit [Candidatus Avidesulfovibrio excrementigallinarum]|nr:efflux RND transporter periplasmic adaptor subunit [Candidatus Avidesulfovibrio excrementigallinarum]
MSKVWSKTAAVRLPVILAGVFVLISLGGCDMLPWVGKEKAAQSMAKPEVQVMAMQPQRVVFTTEIAGRTAPFRIAEVRPQVSGIIQSRNFEEGADVTEGSTLYQIDPATYQAEYDSAKAALARAEANILPLRLKRNRFKDLISVSAVSKQEYEDADAALKQAVADVAVQKAAVKTAAIRLDYTRVNAPISGRAGLSTVTAGALVTANQGEALTTIQQLDPMYVDVTQSSTEMLRLRRAMASGQLKADAGQAVVRLTLEDGTPYAHEGRLQFTDVTVDRSTGMVTLRAIFPNPDKELLPNMYVRAELVEGVSETAMLAPQRAVMRDANGNASVYVVTADNKIEQHPIKVSRTSGDKWIVTSGIEPGDRIVVEGLQRIRPGAAVRVVEMPAEQAAPSGQSGGAAAR